MTSEEVIEELKDILRHISYDGDEDEVGYYSCCNQVSYKGHAKDCSRQTAIIKAIEIVGKSEWLEEQNGKLVGLLHESEQELEACRDANTKQKKRYYRVANAIKSWELPEKKYDNLKHIGNNGRGFNQCREIVRPKYEELQKLAKEVCNGKR